MTYLFPSFHTMCVRDRLWSKALNWQEKVLAKDPKFVCWGGSDLELLTELWEPQKLPSLLHLSPELDFPMGNFDYGFEDFNPPPSEFFWTSHEGIGQCEDHALYRKVAVSSKYLIQNCFLTWFSSGESVLRWFWKYAKKRVLITLKHIMKSHRPRLLALN